MRTMQPPLASSNRAQAEWRLRPSSLAAARTDRCRSPTLHRAAEPRGEPGEHHRRARWPSWPPGALRGAVERRPDALRPHVPAFRRRATRLGSRCGAQPVAGLERRRGRCRKPSSGARSGPQHHAGGEGVAAAPALAPASDAAAASSGVIGLGHVEQQLRGARPRPRARRRRAASTRSPSRTDLEPAVERGRGAERHLRHPRRPPAAPPARRCSRRWRRRAAR